MEKPAQQGIHPTRQLSALQMMMKPSRCLLPRTQARTKTDKRARKHCLSDVQATSARCGCTKARLCAWRDAQTTPKRGSTSENWPNEATARDLDERAELEAVWCVLHMAEGPCHAVQAWPCGMNV